MCVYDVSLTLSQISLFQLEHSICIVLVSRNKSMKFRNKHISGAVNSLLESISDKDDGVKGAVERSLVRMCKRRPNETIEIIYAYRHKCPKLAEPQISILLR